MIEKFSQFWNAFWNAFKSTYNKVFKHEERAQVQHFRDIKSINILAIFVQKLSSLVNTDATFDIEAATAQADTMKELCDDLEAKRFELCDEMLSLGDCWVFPSTDNAGDMFHRVAKQENVRVLNTDGERVTDLIAVVDTFADKNNKVYFLVRRHTLDGDTLTVDTYTTNESYKRVPFEQWAEHEGTYAVHGATGIGAGRFKSPVSSHGLSPVYGVPLNFACAEEEKRIREDLQEIQTELLNNRSILFADPLILKKAKKDFGGNGWTIPENLFPIDTRGGQANNNIDIFAPSYRFDQLLLKLERDLALYEQQIGTDKGFLTEYNAANTATEVRRANASTIALIGRIQSAMAAGIKETLAADAMFLGISEELYSVKIDWYDLFADPDAQFSRIREAAKDGYAEEIDVMQWLFPDMSLDDLNAKLERIREQKQQNLIDFNMQKVIGGDTDAGNPFEAKQDEPEPEQKKEEQPVKE